MKRIFIPLREGVSCIRGKHKVIFFPLHCTTAESEEKKNEKEKEKGIHVGLSVSSTDYNTIQYKAIRSTATLIPGIKYQNQINKSLYFIHFETE
jgi:hypothetical protein